MNDQAAQQEQLTQMLQQQLRDIHLPDAIGWWPLAIGWWVLAALVIALIIWSVYKIRQRQQSNRYRHQALKELATILKAWNDNTDQHVKNSRFLHSTNALLKRVVNHIDPTATHANKTGQAWVDALNSYINTPLDTSVTHALTVANYQSNPNVDVSTLHSHIRHWIKSHQTKPSQQVTKTGSMKDVPIKNSGDIHV